MQQPRDHAHADDLAIPSLGGRLDRRRRATRAALVGAARNMLVHSSADQVSIQQITDAADVGFGSFYNHFESKAELFEVAMEEVLEEHGQLLDAVTAALSDPAEVLALSIRATGRVVATQPDNARIMVRGGLRLLGADHGLAPRALRDLRRGITDARFSQADPRTALALVGGGLLGVLQTWLDRLEVDRSPQALLTAVDELVELVLRSLGVLDEEAHELAHRPLPELITHEVVPSVRVRGTGGVR